MEKITNQELRDLIANNAKMTSAEIADMLSSSENWTWDKRELIRRRINMQKSLMKKGLIGHNKGMKESPDTSSKTVSESSSGSEYEYKGRESITSLDQAIKFFDIDTDVWMIDRWVCNSWDVSMKGPDGQPSLSTNYQVKVWCRRIEDEERIFRERLDYLNKELDSIPPSYKAKSDDVGGIIVACLADLHTGAKTNKRKGIIRTKDFDLQKLREYLFKAAQKINSVGASKVHIAILGDLIESLVGTNHINSWFSMEEDIVFGNSMVVTYKIIDEFLSQVNNLDEVNIVAGNHDRATDRNDHDVTGTAAKMVAFMLKRDYTVSYHPMIISKVYDNISYLFTHGHFGFAKKNLGEVFYKYGDTSKYNVLACGHLHYSSSKKPFMVETSPISGVDYRAVIVAPFFTGNFFSESIGFTGTAGFSIFCANEEKNNIDHLDVGI